MKLSDLGDIEIVRATIILEAGGEPFLGKLAVPCVIRNRMADKRWPNTWHEVILQPRQFSCLNDLSPDKDLDEKWVEVFTGSRREAQWWRECQFAAFGAVHNWYGDITGGANHYHAEYVHPSWAEKGKVTCRFGRHIFYIL